MRHDIVNIKSRSKTINKISIKNIKTKKGAYKAPFYFN
ncbi:hypothetical protein PROCH_0600 [Prochlorococcus marinus str. EQPAC1]|nr:hypothetical protein PROCH_0600 [Prochlorococcus marinus str. EQPAC1]